MPSDASRLAQAVAALEGRCAPFRAAALRAAEELGASLRDHDGAPASGRRALEASFGQLGGAHLDLSQLAALLEAPEPQGGDLPRVMRAAAAVMQELAGFRLEPVVLAPGEPLAAAVGDALARLGRAFGAAHAVALARSGRYQRGLHHPWLGAYPFADWTHAERMLAPPLVVSLAGADLKAGALEDFLDGSVKLALVVRDGVAPSAALVRLVTPGLYVVQTHDGAQLSDLAARDGPGVVAWVPESSAAFVHDPAAGATLPARLQVLHMPPGPRRRLGGRSASQLAEERAQLDTLAQLGAPVPAAAPAASNDPVDRLTDWILRQAALDGAGREVQG